MKKSKADSPSDTYCKTVDEFEARFVRPKEGKALVVGSKVYASRVDRRKRYKDCIGVDMLAGEGVDIVCNLENDLPFHLGKFAHCDLISVLEHSKRPWRLAENLQWLLPVGCTLFVQAPLTWRLHGYPNDYFRYTTEGIRALFPMIEWTAMQYVHGLPTERIPAVWHDKLLYFARTEVCGFGHKR